MPETLFDPTQYVPANAKEAAAYLNHVALWLCVTARANPDPLEDWLALKEAELTLTILAHALEHPTYRPRCEEWLSRWPLPLSDNRTESETQ